MDPRATQLEEESDSNSMVHHFWWATMGVESLLPPSWKQDILEVAARYEINRVLVPPHSTSREDPSVSSLSVRGVGGRIVQQELPWLTDLYRGKFRKLGEQCRAQPLTTAVDPRYAVVLNVQKPGERYECHVDTNPVEGLLYVTSHPKGHGGELAIANSVNADSMEKIDADCTALYPEEAHLVFFDGRFHPHYVPPLRQGEIRVAVAMNYYTATVPESTRPVDLNDYLYGKEA